MHIRYQRATAPADAELAAPAGRCLLLRLQHRSDRVSRIDVARVDARRVRKRLRQADGPQVQQSVAVAA